MSLINTVADHHKEYFYKISANGSKLFYHRTAEGHKRIAKKEIPVHLIDSIKAYDEKLDQDWLKHKNRCDQEMEEITEKLSKLHTSNLSEINIEKSRKILTDRLAVRKSLSKTYDKRNAEESERRYKEETDRYGGFEGYFEKKYNRFFRSGSAEDTYKRFFGAESSPKDEYKSSSSSSKDEYRPTPCYRKNDFSILIEEGIIENTNTSKEIAKQNYRRWLVHNHPDKGGDTEICAKVISQYQDFEAF